MEIYFSDNIISVIHPILFLLMQVRRTVRCDVSHQGRKVVAICLDDIESELAPSATCTSIRKAVKSERIGVHGVTKDFVPPDSTCSNIKRGVNSHSRKCTVICLDQLPEWLQEQLVEGTNPKHTHFKTPVLHQHVCPKSSVLLRRLG